MEFTRTPKQDYFLRLSRLKCDNFKNIEKNYDMLLTIELLYNRLDPIVE